MELPFLPSFKTANSTPTTVAPSFEPNIFQKALAGPIERVGAAVESVKQGSIKPLAESFQKQGKELSQPVALGTMPSGQKLTIPKIVQDAAFAATGARDFVPVNPIAPVVSKLISAIKDAKPVRAQANSMASIERGQRAGAGAGALKAGSGEGAFYSALGQLKGELPKPQFEGVRAPKGETNTTKLTQPDVDMLFNAVKEHPMDFYSQINAMSGLSKILGEGGGQIPTPGELKLLGKIFGSELPTEVFSKRSLGTKVLDVTKDLLNVPRSLMSSIDMSAPFRQGAVLFANNPKQGAQAFKEMFKYFGSPKYFDAAMEDIQRRPSFGLMRQSGLAVTDASPLNFALDAKEEAFMSNLAGKIPGVGRLVNASERAYTGFLNKLRADVFDDISKQYIEGGVTPHDDPQVFERLAEFVNTASGRGNLGPLNKAAPILNGVFFSPRFMASRFQMLNPQWYFSQTPQVRKLAMLSAVKFVSTGLGILALAKAGGADVETNPTSADFGQIKIDNFRWDVWAGFRPWINLIAREITGERKSTTSGNSVSANRLQTAGNFLRSKLAPIPGLGVNLLDMKDAAGQPIDINAELVDKVIPLYVQDVREAVKQGGFAGGVGVGIPAFFGVGTNAYAPTPSKKSKGLPSLPQLPALPKLPRLPSL